MASAWLPPAILTSTAGSAVLFAVFLYLHLAHGRERHVALWAGAWALSFVRYALSLVAVLGWPGGAAPAPLQAATYLATLGSTLLLLWGTHEFIGMRLPRFWLAFTAAVGAWVVIALAGEAGFLALTVPVFWFLGATSVWTGARFLRWQEVPGIGHLVTGWAFIVWGLHRLDYPFVRPVEALAVGGFMLAGLLEFVLTIGMLIVHMEKALERLRESEERYRRLVEGSPDAILLVRAGAPVFMNEPARRLLGGGPAAEGLAARLVAAAAAPGPSEVREGERDLEVRSTPLGPGAAQVVVQDVTERRRLEERLRDAAKMEAVGRLAGGVAHDFNNLLTAILGYTSLLLLETRPEDPRREHVEEVQRACERAADLTRQLLAFARRQPLEPKVVVLDDLVRGATLLIQRLVGERIRVEARLAAPAARLLADPGQLELAIVNLAVNARDAMPAGGALTIETRRVDAGDLPPGLAWPLGGVALSVADTGAGMDEATRRRAFEPFFTTKPPGQGTGLGLSTVHGIVDRCGGRVDVESAPGRGTRFTVLLPRTDAAAPPAPPEPLDAPAPARGTVLLAEDEPAVRAMAARALQGVGYAVLACGSGEEALAAAAGHPGPIDLLLTDVVMSGMSGVELARRLRAARPDLRVLLVSGYAPELLEAGDAPPGPLLLKPFSAGALTARVREVLEAAPARQPA
ncbi:MAG: ATP-binding protein [Planctomycetes bacterium]|nr:ATP-binding protein [Planctomycetota bacterium]